MTDADRLPTDPQDLLLLINALVDGELDAATALALERRFEADRELAAEYARIRALKELLSDGCPVPSSRRRFTPASLRSGQVRRPFLRLWRRDADRSTGAAWPLRSSSPRSSPVA